MLAINTNSLKHVSLEKALEFIYSELGCSNVELTTDGRAHGYRFMFDFMYRFGMHIFPPVNFISFGGGWVDFVRKDLALLEKQFDVCSFLGIKKIRFFVSNPHNEPEVNRGNFVAAVSNIRDCAKANPNFIFMLENHGGLTRTGALTSAIVRHINMSNVRLVYDPANYIRCGEDPIGALSTTYNYIEHVHVKDIDADGHFCSVGEGITPWPEILNMLKYRGYHNYYSIEYEGEGDRFEGLKESYLNFIKLYEECL
jgi:sugar phosphate isomerase/epimerase